MAPSKKPSSKKAPTGRPRGRPRKHPLPAAAEPAVQSSGKALDAVNETMQPANSAAVAPDVAMLETVQPDNVSAGFTAAAQSTAQPDNSSSGSFTVAAQETMQPINASVVSAIVGGETSDTPLNVPGALPPFTAARLDKLPSPDKVLAEADSILSRSFDPAVSAVSPFPSVAFLPPANNGSDPPAVASWLLQRWHSLLFQGDLACFNQVRPRAWSQDYF
jgi:hypothetical protein